MRFKGLLTTRIALPIATFAGGIFIGAVFFAGSLTPALDEVEHSGGTQSSAITEAPPIDGTTRRPADDLAPEPKTPARKVAATIEETPFGETREGPSALSGLSISGSVLDWNGNPLSGATVRVVRRIESRPKTSSVGEGFEPWETFEQEVAELAADYSRRSASRGESNTSTDGTFSIDGLTAGAYRVEARAAGYVLRPSGGGFRVFAGSRINFRADGVSEVPLTLSRGDGGPLPEAVIQLSWLTKGRFDDDERLWQSADPVLALTQERYTLKARLDTEHARRLGISGAWASEKVEVEVIEGAVPGPVHLTLQPRSGVQGRVLVPPDVALDYVHLKLTAIDPNDSTDVSEQWDRGGSTLSTHVYNAYAFEFLDLDPGHYQLLVSRDPRGSTGVDAISIEVSGGIIERDVPLPELDLNRAILIHANDARGRPIDDTLTIYMQVETSETKNTEAMNVVAQSPGIYTAAIPGAYQGIVDGKVSSKTTAVVTIMAQHSELGRVSAILQRGQREVRLTFLDPAMLYLTVNGLQNSGGVTNIQAILDRSVQRNSSIVEANGPALLGPSQPGPAHLRLLAVSGPGRYTDVFSDTVDLVAGANHRTITLPSLHTLRVRIPDALTPVTAVRLSAEEGEASYQGAVKDGSAHFVGLLAGRYRLRLWGSPEGSQAMHVQIPAVTDIEFVGDGD